MKLVSFRVRMFRSVLDSGLVPVFPVTALVGTNESGKTSLLRGLYSLAPLFPSAYQADVDWPREVARKPSARQVVASAELELDEREGAELARAAGLSAAPARVAVARDYAGRLSAEVPGARAPWAFDVERLRARVASLAPRGGAGSAAHDELARRLRDDAPALAGEGRLAELVVVLARYRAQARELDGSRSLERAEPELRAALVRIDALAAELEAAARVCLSGEERFAALVEARMPRLALLDARGVPRGTVLVDQLRERRERRALADDDRALLALLAACDLQLDELCAAPEPARLERAARAFGEAQERGLERVRHVVRFELDDQRLRVLLGAPGGAPMALEAHSTSRAWAFTLDVLRLAGSAAGRELVLLLDDPGLALDPERRGHLRRAVERSAGRHTVVYSSQLPFVVDLQYPEQILVLRGGAQGTRVRGGPRAGDADGALALEAALGVGGRSSFLLAERNLVVEGLNDRRILVALSDLLARSGEPALPGDVVVTPAGGAAEVTGIARFLLGLGLGVVALYDGDPSGDAARAKLEAWVAEHADARAAVLGLGALLGLDSACAIEDLFPVDWFLGFVQELLADEPAPLELVPETLPAGDGELAHRVRALLEQRGLRFHKGLVARRIAAAAARMPTIVALRPDVAERARRVVGALAAAVERL